MAKPELLRMDDVAREFKFPTRSAAAQWVKRHIPYIKMGRIIMIYRSDLEAELKLRFKGKS